MSKKSVVNFIGRVIDYRKQAPIRGAKVSLNTDDISLVSYTDLEGIYRFQVSPDKSKNVRAEISVEASGYKRYQRLISLSSNQKDLGDIWLGAPSQQNSNQDGSLTPLIAVIIIAFLIFLLLAITNSPRRGSINNRNPRNDSIDYELRR
ncbi:MAG: carboxypeptidase regulatory-like domain-containing protein [Calothrix sp. C42_A2020_038]|nr:carboxypeptidase regulatory-like domain-containing protein [Calothrix sp. C42_A2020_038]